MTLDQAANFVVDELQSSVSDTATTFSVGDASQFPDPANGEYNLVVFDASRPSKDPDVEVVRVTGRDTTNDGLTVTRGQETTTAASHASGTAVELSYTAKFRDDIQTELDNAGTTVTSIAPTEATDGGADQRDDGALAISPTSPGYATQPSAIAIGGGTDSTGFGAISIGEDSYSGGSDSVAVGRNANAGGGGYGVAIGSGAKTSFGQSAVGIGKYADGRRQDSIAIGRDAESDAKKSIALGTSANTITEDVARIGTKQTVIGAIDGGQIADADLNNSELTFELDEANSNIVFRVKNSSGTVKTGTVSLS